MRVNIRYINSTGGTPSIALLLIKGMTSMSDFAGKVKIVLESSKSAAAVSQVRDVTFQFDKSGMVRDAGLSPRRSWTRLHRHDPRRAKVPAPLKNGKPRNAVRQPS